MKGEGPAVCVGRDIDTDLIIAGRYLRTTERSIWAAHTFEDLDPAMAGRLKGAVIVAGENFGCGSSREQAPVALKMAGVVGIVAPSFARIFFRNAINIGLPLIEADLRCVDGETVTFDLAEGVVTVGERTISVTPLSSHMQAILDAGGLVAFWKERR
ncbi:LeuD/DmdB family oxidoreductase small subunit [Methanosphaerula palustris]|uniref:3-isopropylmalate dehydratase, small subunit n=1 Tax=Methanosphaerula palustris (strain ATCC BAA-1556 / DSM 19958 / E1-9c) TaxID=521011 RepID=B8GDU1_METPE|nr:3-isopropylmalate dehydratase small subunit [Methanosphaerula palustris]ACL17442.1 3-isopropylmalate dehydratase, small subunit [Methanosphaerula palustris E1-9c]